MKPKFKTVLFDLDGTLLDTAPDLAIALNVVLQNHHCKLLPFEIIRPYASTGTRGLLNLGFAIDEKNPRYEQLRQQFLDAYHQHLYDKTSIFPGIEKLLLHLENLNIPWGVVTNKPENLAKQLLDQFDLTSRCSCVVGGDTLTKRKPDPEPLLHACELIGSKTANTIYIGDAERDVMAAKSANMSSIVALYGYIAEYEEPKNWQADYYVDHPEQIIKLL